MKMTCSNPNHARDIRRVGGCTTCRTCKARPDQRKGKSPARQVAQANTEARRVVVPVSIAAQVLRVCTAVRESPELADEVNAALGQTIDAHETLAQQATSAPSSKPAKPKS